MKFFISALYHTGTKACRTRIKLHCDCVRRRLAKIPLLHHFRKKIGLKSYGVVGKPASEGFCRTLIPILLDHEHLTEFRRQRILEEKEEYGFTRLFKPDQIVEHTFKAIYPKNIYSFSTFQSSEWPHLYVHISAPHFDVSWRTESVRIPAFKAYKPGNRQHLQEIYNMSPAKYRELHSGK